MGAGVDSRTMYVDLAATEVAPQFADGATRSTCGPAVGGAMAAGSTEDGPFMPTFAEGRNAFLDKTTTAMYTADPALAACQAPKDIFVDGRKLNSVWPWIQTKVPVSVVRVGQVWLVAIPGEVTIGAGLRLRQTVASAVGTGVNNVLVQGYTNSYIHYLTTPEEYGAQNYEGGSTLFGRWELGAFRQAAHRLATAVADGSTPPLGPVSPDLTSYQLVRYPTLPLDVSLWGMLMGTPIRQPAATYTRGQSAVAEFRGAHPSNVVKRGGTYLEVQRREGTSWVRYADDGDWETIFRWRREGVAGSIVTVEWRILDSAPAGTYRLRYYGDARSLLTRGPIVGTSRSFGVSGSRRGTSGSAHKTDACAPDYCRTAGLAFVGAGG